MENQNTQTKSNVNPKPSGFKKAEKQKAWIKIAITGPSGSGKTYSALSIASGLGKKIALIDTENRSSLLYGDRFQFDQQDILPPYTIAKYVACIQDAINSGYEVLIIDSISHAWAGDGGLLAQKEDLDARGKSGDRGNKNQYANWSGITKQHEQFKSWLVNANIHLIVTMRSKQDYVLMDGGKIQKVGMAPIQRDGMEYEFTTVLDLAMNHSASASKDRTSMFDNTFFTPSSETGTQFLQWLNSGTGELKQRPVETKPPEKKPSPDQLQRLYAIAADNSWEHGDVGEYMKKTYKQSDGRPVTSSKELTLLQYNLLCSHIMSRPKDLAIPPEEIPSPPVDTTPLKEEEKLPFEKQAQAS